MIEFKTNLTSGERKVFAALFPAFGGLVGWYISRRTGLSVVGWSVFATTLVISMVGLAWPPLLRGVFVVWMALVFPIGWVVSHLILIVLFYVVISPVALIMKVLKFDPLQRRRDPNAKTYWQPHSPASNAKRYFRQF